MNSQYPPVSVIIPMLNERDYIERCLDSIICQDYPHERLEILVVDGNSDDGCDRIVLDFARQHSEIPIQLLRNPRQVIPAALNIGIDSAQGEIVVRVDTHTCLAPDYVSTCVCYLTNGKADNVGGLMRPVGTTYTGRAIALATSSPFGIGGSKFHYSDREQYGDTVYLGAYWRKTFDEIGRYDETLHINEDYELNYRLRQAGGKILLSPAIRSTYFPRSSLGGLWRQYFNYGRWKVRMLQKHPRSLRWRQAIPPLFIAVMVGTLLLALFWTPGRWLFGIVMLSYLLPNLVASTISACCKNWGYLPVMPPVFGTIHVAWGLGFWYGLLLIPFSTK
jgi:glycosyltransferase involved in cell wall biosynthesis